jgi:hypothetical protein
MGCMRLEFGLVRRLEAWGLSDSFCYWVRIGVLLDMVLLV